MLCALARLTLVGFSGCSNAISRLPHLTRLVLAQRTRSNAVSDLVCVPRRLAGLPRLAKLHMQGVTLGSSLLGLLCLTRLTNLIFDWSTFGSEGLSTAHLSSALRCLTELRHFRYFQSLEGLQCEAFSG